MPDNKGGFKWTPIEAPSEPSMGPLDYARTILAGGARVAGPWLGALAGGALTAPTGPGAVGGAMAGGAAGGALSEALAEMIEPHKPDHKVNLGRVLVSTGLGAIPGSALVRESKAASAALGAGVNYAAGVGNKMSEGTPMSEALVPKGSDALGMGIGALTGTGFSWLHGRSKAPTAPPTGGLEDAVIQATSKPPKGPTVIHTGTGETITAPRLVPKPGGLRVKTGNEPAPAVQDAARKTRLNEALPTPEQKAAEPDLSKVKEALKSVDEAAQSASDISKAQRAVNDKGDKSFLKRIVDKEKAATQAAKLVKSEETAATKVVEKDSVQAAKNLKAKDAYAEGEAKSIEKAIEKDATQHGKNLNAKDKYAQGEATAIEKAQTIESKVVEKDAAQHAKNLNEVDKYAESEAASIEKAAKEKAASDQITAHIENEDLESKGKSLSERVTEKTAAGTRTLTERFGPKEPDKTTGGDTSVGPKDAQEMGLTPPENLKKPKKGSESAADLRDRITEGGAKVEVVKPKPVEVPKLTKDEQDAVNRLVKQGYKEKDLVNEILKRRKPTTPKPTTPTKPTSPTTGKGAKLAESESKGLDEFSNRREEIEAAGGHPPVPEINPQGKGTVPNPAGNNKKLQEILKAASPEGKGLKPPKQVKPGIKSQKGQASTGALIKGTGLGVGAVTGATLDKKDRLRGAILGGAAGLALGSAPGLANKETLDAITSRIPNAQRSALLSHPLSIIHNSFGGPWGSGFFGGLEHFVEGSMPGGSQNNKEVGAKLIKSMFSPKLGKKYLDVLPDAEKLINDSEREGGNLAGHTWIDKLMGIPAKFMVAGDETVRNTMLEAGMDQATARKLTNTADPKLALVRNMVNFGKAKDDAGNTSKIAQLMLPFKRTAGNILENGLERTPVIGEALNAFRNPDDVIPFTMRMAQQGIGAGVYLGAYELGKITPEHTAQSAKMRTLVSNIAGPYALISGAAFAMGQAARKGNSKASGLVSNLEQNIPLPTLDVAKDAAAAVNQGKPQKLLRSFYPRILDPAQELIKKIYGQ